MLIIQRFLSILMLQLLWRLIKLDQKRKILPILSGLKPQNNGPYFGILYCIFWQYLCTFQSISLNLSVYVHYIMFIYFYMFTFKTHLINLLAPSQQMIFVSCRKTLSRHLRHFVIYILWTSIILRLIKQIFILWIIARFW